MPGEDPTDGTTASESFDEEAFSWQSSQPALDRLPEVIRETLDANRRVVPGRLGTVRGFGAGAVYPQIWLRDSATLIEVSRYLCRRDCLTSWIEEHLAHQRPDGSLFDWIAAGDPGHFRTDAPHVREVHRRGALVVSADRNSAAADQESSAVQAAAQVFAILGDRDWLRRSIVGRPLVARLADALQYVVTHRIDPETGLVTAAFTADWGDVSPVHRNQYAIYLDEQTPVVGGLYASAMFVRAAIDLSELYRAIGDGRAAGRWRLQAMQVSEAIDRTLWIEEAGFYRVHQILRTPADWRAPDPGDRFALGGNAVALLAGVADETRVPRVLEAAVARQGEFGLPTISGVLLPPYPRGTFRHPMLDETFKYQNGGQWDWWGGRLLLAAFELGYADTARDALARIVEQTTQSGGLYEWTTPQGRGRGSPTYAGTAGVIGTAVLRGLYGLALRHDGLDIHVRLGTENGGVRVHEPVTGATVRYDYRYDAAMRQAVLEYAANVAGRGTLAVRLPPDASAASGRMDDGPEQPLDIHYVGRDRYARLLTDWAPHTLELTFR